MAKRKKTKTLPAKAAKGEETYKVRAAITLAHYLFVKASSPDEAECKVDEYIRHKDRDHGGYDWYGEASHMHTSYEVEEAE
jgi:hypothetical protein